MHKKPLGSNKRAEIINRTCEEFGMGVTRSREYIKLHAQFENFATILLDFGDDDVSVAVCVRCVLLHLLKW